MLGRIAKLMVHAFEVGGTGSMDLAGAPFIQHHRAECKDIRQFAGELLRERLTSLNQQDRSTEAV